MRTLEERGYEVRYGKWLVRGRPRAVLLDPRCVRDRLAEMQGGTLAFGFSGNPKEPSAMRGGPVFEFLFGIDSWLRKQGRRERFKLVFFTPAEKPGEAAYLIMLQRPANARYFTVARTKSTKHGALVQRFGHLRRRRLQPLRAARPAGRCT